MLNKKKRSNPKVDSSSMADIAFLLLIFFLVTTTIASDKGIMMQLPPEAPPEDIQIKQKNLFKILVNSSDKLLVEDEPMDISQVKDECKKFLTNNGKDPKSSDSPKDAITSIKTDRGTTYSVYISVLDEVKRAYHEVRAEHVGITLQEYLALDKDDKEGPDYKKYQKAKDAYPMQISEADPSDVKK